MKVLSMRPTFIGLAPLIPSGRKRMLDGSGRATIVDIATAKCPPLTARTEEDIVNIT